MITEIDKLELKNKIIFIKNTQDHLMNMAIAYKSIFDFLDSYNKKDWQEYYHDETVDDETLKIFTAILIYDEFLNDPRFRGWIYKVTLQ